MLLAAILELEIESPTVAAISNVDELNVLSSGRSEVERWDFESAMLRCGTGMSPADHCGYHNRDAWPVAVFMRGAIQGRMRLFRVSKP